MNSRSALRISPAGTLRSELLDRKADIAEDSPQNAFGDIAIAVHGDGGAAPIRMAHDVVTAADAGDLEAMPFQGVNYANA